VGALQIRSLVPGQGSTQTYIGASANVTPRAAISGTINTVPLNGTSQLLFSGSLSGNTYTGAAIYQFTTQLQALTQASGGSTDFGSMIGYSINWQFSTDNTNWSSFSRANAYGVLNGYSDIQFVSNELTATNAPSTSASTVYFRCYIKSNTSTSDYVTISNVPWILQLR
jgi:hypothetical protein